MSGLPNNITEPIRRSIICMKRVVLRRFSFSAFLRTINPIRFFPEPWRKQVTILSAILISTAVIGLCFSLAVIWPMPYRSKVEKVEIPYASTAREVANQLEARGIIRSRTSFLWYLRLTGQAGSLRAGIYQFHPGYTFARIVKELESGTPLVYRITIPEGFTAKEVTGLLAAKHLINPERFQKLLTDPVFLGSHLEGFGEVSSGEGFLFPDTYEFAHGVSEEEILITFFRRFMEVWREEKKHDTTKRDALQILTMASIIEKEAKASEERPVIAGVFYNRLTKRIPLESCATIQYALGRHKTKLYYKDLWVHSKYNTYRNYGLPPGPICNPGEASIDAAMRPANHQYLYFVAKPDGHHVFSVTYREHLIAQKRLE
ncbi:MAG TPA: endolytic transglycosylase MltG [Bacillota bacterium]|nr:endolytic transglycosylase MltG [Bacillota bacterium]